MYLGKIYSVREREFPLSEMDTEGGQNYDDAKIKLRLLTPGEQRSIVNATYDQRMTTDEGGAFVPDFRLVPIKGRERMFMLTVIGWSGIFEDEEETKPLKLTAQNKRKLLDYIPDLLDFVAECHGKMVVEAQESREEEEKNS